MVIMKMLQLCYEYIVLSLSNIIAYRLRSLLTMLGIIIGICALIVMLMLGESNKAKVLEELQRAGPNNIMIQVPRIGFAQQYLNKQVFSSLSYVKSFSFMQQTTAVYGMGNEFVQGTVLGVSDEFQKLHNLVMFWGRRFSQLDYISEDPICLIDQLALKRYYPMADIHHLSVYVGKQRFKVIGVFKTEQPADVYRPLIYLPAKQYHKLYSQRKNDNYIVVVSNVERFVKKVAAIKSTLAQYYHDGRKVEVQSFSEIVKLSANISGQIKFFVYGFALILLTVGGIGIMNTMLISVSERTREVGVRRAIGATFWAVFGQFLVEAILICLVAGCIGMLVGSCLGILLVTWMQLTLVIAWGPIINSVLISILVGLAAGIYPSIKAARLDPIKALKYE